MRPEAMRVTLLRRVVDDATARLHADRGTLYLVDHARRELVSRVADLPELGEIRLRIGEGAAGRAVGTGQLVNVPRASSSSAIQHRFDGLTGYRTVTTLAAPVVGPNGVVLAVLQLLNKQDGDFDASDERLLSELAAQVASLLEGIEGPDTAEAVAPLVGASAVMQRAYERAARAARTDAAVLVRGESGTGKGLLARAIHEGSSRRDGPFVRVDCAALPEALVENELFGHEAGAYTGGERAADGRVHAARGGTLFLDEVGELPPSVQGKLLGLLQEGSYVRVGGTRPRAASVRFIFATHRDLEAAVASGSLRLDLYYRLRVVEIVVPPLRDRGAGDLDLLIDHFLVTLCRRHGRAGLRLPSAARAALHVHDWPGNVRELEHAIESAVVLAPGPDITFDLGQRLLPAPPVEACPGVFLTAPRLLADVERDYVAHVVRHCGGNRSAAARLLGIGRNTLARKLSGGD